MNTISPRRAASLLAQCEQRANDDHSRRLAEMHQLAPLLERLEPVLPALQAAGLHWSPADLSLRWHYPAGAAGLRRSRQRALRIYTRLLASSNNTTPQRWIDTLLAQGFREIHRTEALHYPEATLQRGYLLLVVDAPEPAASASAAAKAKAEHQRRAEDAFAGVSA